MILESKDATWMQMWIVLGISVCMQEKYIHIFLFYTIWITSKFPKITMNNSVAFVRLY